MEEKDLLTAYKAPRAKVIELKYRVFSVRAEGPRNSV